MRLLFMMLLAASVQAADKPMDGTFPAGGAALVERLGERMPLDVRLRDEHGRAVRFGDLVGSGKPLLLIPGYYRCPMLCGLVLDGMSRAVRSLGWMPGDQYRIASFSFDASETSADAEHRQGSLLATFADWPSAGAQLPSERWPFLVAPQLELDRLLRAIGLRIARDGTQIAHPAVAVIITPDGRISRYLYGIEFPARDLRLALVEAADGRIGTLGDRILLYCYHWDPAAHRYGWAVVGLLRGGGLLTLALMAIGWWWLVRRRPKVVPIRPTAAR
jgi:protein SCO1/2